MSTRYKGSLISATPASSSSTAAYGLWKQSDAAQLVNNAWPATDPYWSSVSLLVSGNPTSGTSNGTVIDSSVNAYTITSTFAMPQGAYNPFSTTAPYTPSINGGSIYNNQTGTILTPSSATSWSFGTGAFTIEGWINPSQIATTVGMIVSNFVATTFVVGQWKFGCNTATGQLVFTWATSTTLTSTITSGANVVTLNAWQHVAVVRNGTTITIYLNGTSVGSGTMSTSLGATGTLGVGYQQTGTAANFNGFLSSIRIVKGTAVYTSNFTPPTAPLTAISGTELLLNFTNAIAIDNSMTTNISFNAAVTAISYSNVKYGTGSLSFTSSYSLLPNATKLQLGTGDFTIEGWITTNPTNLTASYVSKGTTTTGWEIGTTSGGLVIFSYTATSLTGATAIKRLTWYHVAVVRSGSGVGNLKLYLNGVLDATSSVAVTDNFNETNDLFFNYSRAGTITFTTNIDDFRITKGVARYTANFTPPQQSLPIQ